MGRAPGPAAPQVVSCPAQPLLPLQLCGRVCGLVAAVHPHLGGLGGAFTKCHSTCLQGERGSEQKLALEHGHRSENLQGRKQRVSGLLLSGSIKARPPLLTEAVRPSVRMIYPNPHNSIPSYRHGHGLREVSHVLSVTQGVSGRAWVRTRSSSFRISMINCPAMPPSLLPSLDRWSLAGSSDDGLAR